MSNQISMSNELEYTGERMIPGAADANTYWEHAFRYAFACKHISHMRVLDIASGEGYGSYALSKLSNQVIGIDISREAVAHAVKKYNLDFRLGDAESIPLDSESMDAVVSFETIEHVPDPEKFVHEVSRVMSPGGQFFVSTPNKGFYLSGQEANPFHCSELTLDEFTSLLNKHFHIKAIYGQIFPRSRFDDLQDILGHISDRLAYFVRMKSENIFRSWFLPELDAKGDRLRCQMIERIHLSDPFFERSWNPYALRKLGDHHLGQPTYFIAVAERR